MIWYGNDMREPMMTMMQAWQRVGWTYGSLVMTKLDQFYSRKIVSSTRLAVSTFAMDPTLAVLQLWMRWVDLLTLYIVHLRFSRSHDIHHLRHKEHHTEGGLHCGRASLCDGLANLDHRGPWTGDTDLQSFWAYLCLISWYRCLILVTFFIEV